MNSIAPRRWRNRASLSKRSISIFCDLNPQVRKFLLGPYFTRRSELIAQEKRPHLVRVTLCYSADSAEVFNPGVRLCPPPFPVSHLT